MATSIQVTFDCADPTRLARFWQAALGYRGSDPPPGHESWEAWARAEGIPEERWNDAADAIDPEGKGPRLLFQRVPEPKSIKNRVHLDVNAGAGLRGDERRARVDAEVSRLTAEGATLVEARGRDGEYWVVMQDPEGNEFCVQ